MADSKKRSRGPKTPNGKASPSQNSTNHGCNGKTLVLSGESHEEFDALRAGRLKEFEPEGYQEERLLKILILNDCWLKRAERKLEEAEAAVFEGGEDFHRVELRFSRTVRSA